MQTTGISSLWGCKATGCQPFGRTAHYYNIYRTQDGRYLSVGTIEPKFWRRLCEILGCEELIERQHDFEHGNELQERLAAVFQTKTQAEWLALIGEEEFCVTPLLGDHTAEVLTELGYTEPEIMKLKETGAI